MLCVLRQLGPHSLVAVEPLPTGAADLSSPYGFRNWQIQMGPRQNPFYFWQHVVQLLEDPGQAVATSVEIQPPLLVTDLPTRRI